MAWKVFYSYAHEDEAHRRQLGTALAPLRRAGLIEDWHDRLIVPGSDWNAQIEARTATADLYLVLLSPDFLDSDYGLGVEMEQAFSRVKRGEARLVPVLLRPCLWELSAFSALQMLPRDARPLTTWPNADEPLLGIAQAVRELVSSASPRAGVAEQTAATEPRFDASMERVRRQLRSYARQYERVRQRMPSGHERTRRMEAIFLSMCALAPAAYPLLDELRASPLPGDRLAAVSILQWLADEQAIDFLVELVGIEKPFVGYHALRALRFAVDALDTGAQQRLLAGLQRTRQKLEDGAVGQDADRHMVLRDALQALSQSMAQTG